MAIDEVKLAGEKPTFRHLPAPVDGFGRVETGPVVFGDDWPGLFLRGDNAFGLALSLKSVLRHFEEHSAEAVDVYFALHDLRSLYNSILQQVVIGGEKMCESIEIKRPKPEGPPLTTFRKSDPPGTTE